MIQYVFFDAGGTLIDPYPSVGEIYARARHAHGLNATAEQLHDAFQNIWGRYVARAGQDPMTFGQDNESTRTWWRNLVFEVLDHVDFHGDREACFAAFFAAFESPDAWRVYDDVRPVLDALEARGVRKGVISNWDFRLPPLLDRLELGPRFDPILVSAFEGVAKPNPDLYRRATDRVGVPPEACLYVGDHVHLDLDPAREVGLQAFIIDRKGKYTGDYGVGSLLDLLDHL